MTIKIIVIVLFMPLRLEHKRQQHGPISYLKYCLSFYICTIFFLLQIFTYNVPVELLFCLRFNENATEKIYEAIVRGMLGLKYGEIHF